MCWPDLVLGWKVVSTARTLLSYQSPAEKQANVIHRPIIESTHPLLYSNLLYCIGEFMQCNADRYENPSPALPTTKPTAIYHTRFLKIYMHTVTLTQVTLQQSQHLIIFGQKSFVLRDA